MEPSTDLPELMRQFIAIESVPANALRNQGPGTAATIQAALLEIRLDAIDRSGPKPYKEWLDGQTKRIFAEMPIGCGSWGIVRKAINLFMRGCLCNYLLRRRHALQEIEQYAELSIDNVVAQALKRESGRGQLPAWESIKKMKPEEHERFQEAAKQVADRLGIDPPVFLDNYLWLRDRRPG